MNNLMILKKALEEHGYEEEISIESIEQKISSMRFNIAENKEADPDTFDPMDYDIVNDLESQLNHFKQFDTEESALLLARAYYNAVR